MEGEEVEEVDDEEDEEDEEGDDDDDEGAAEGVDQEDEEEGMSPLDSWVLIDMFFNVKRSTFSDINRLLWLRKKHRREGGNCDREVACYHATPVRMPLRLNLTFLQQLVYED